MSHISKFKIRVEVLSPIHIGNGQELLKDVDFITAGQRTYVLNLDEYAQWAYDSQSSDAWMQNKPGHLLASRNDLATLGLHRYVMNGTPVNNRLRAYVKTVYGEPYIPGSTLKGLLRTLYVWGFYSVKGTYPDLDRLGKNRSWAAQGVEREVMGLNPNLDVFRAVRVSDSTPLDPKVLKVHSVNIYPTTQRSNRGVIVDVEAIPDGSMLTATLSLDMYGFGNAISELGWKGKRKTLAPETIAIFGKAFAEKRLEQEREFFHQHEDVKVVSSFYRSLEAIPLTENQFIAQIGWGTGWNSKTLNDLLMIDQRKFAWLVKTYKMTRFPETFNEKSSFPKSRQILQHGGRYVRPMGWILITVE
jgi:CRISPR-associated protein Csm5